MSTTDPQALSALQRARQPKPKKEKKPIARYSAKARAKQQAGKEQLASQDTFMEQWYRARRQEMTGICQCGCGGPSEKNNNKFFRSSACHILPKAIFESVMYHYLNYVERAWLGGCHHFMDNTSFDNWPDMADWPDIKAKLLALIPLLAPKERSHKMISHIEKLISLN